MNEVAHSAEYDSKSSLAHVRNVLNAIFNKKHSRKKRADCCQLLPCFAMIYFELHPQCKMRIYYDRDSAFDNCSIQECRQIIDLMREMVELSTENQICAMRRLGQFISL
jgi:hypothetical protein